MAVYTHVAHPALERFLAGYDVGALERFEGITAGVENTNYLVETNERRLILTLFEKRVAAADLPYFLGLMDHAKDGPVPVPAPVRNREGNIIGQLHGRPAALVSFLHGRGDLRPTSGRAAAAGQALALFHGATAGFAQRRDNSLGPDGWRELTEKIGTRFDEIDPGLTGEIRNELEALGAVWPGNLPRGTIHADYFPDNVFFDAEDRVSGVIDFYFACTDFLTYDLAVSLNAWALESGTPAEVAEAFLTSYETARPLSEAEYGALPVLLRGAALRFFLTRAHDMLNPVAGSMVRIKDPRPYLELLRRHRQGLGFPERQELP